jgi:large subunit ribosomal protein L18
LYAQLIDDIDMRTLASASTPELRKTTKEAQTNSVATAERLGKLVAERAIAKGLSAAVFDRGGFRFHGKVKALAEGARRQGLML